MTGVAGGRSVAVALVLVGTLTACASPPARLPAAALAAPPTPATDAVGVAAPPSPDVAPLAATEADAPGFWQRLTAGFRFTDCAPREPVATEIRRYLAGGRFASMIEPMLPHMAHVLDEVERRGLPTEFVLLPIVESHYRMAATHGNRPAGPWQLMPGTARRHGLGITERFDARLDLAASTRAALDHVELLADRFGEDWVAVVKAYNAGEFRVRRARERDGLDGWRRALSATTLTHYARLQALACIVRDPARHAVALPDPPDAPPLTAHRVEAELDLDLAAAAAGIDRSTLASSNPAIRGERAPPGSHLLLPRDAVGRLEAALAEIPATERAHWHTVEAANTDWHALAASTTLAAATLAAANGRDLDAAVPTRVVMPGRAATDDLALRPTDGVYLVRKGDSPWSIARRLRVGLAELLAINGLEAGAVLRPGQRLRVP